MKKMVSMFLALGLCIVGLTSCIKVVLPTSQQTDQGLSTTVQQTVPVQSQIPLQNETTIPAQPIQPVQPIQGGYQNLQFNITLEQAIQTTLNAAGMTESNVVFTKQRQDYDDGIPEYEIEFIANNMKYEYEVNGVTGTIIKQEIESVFD